MNKLSETGVFFATSFSGHVDYETQEVNPDFRLRIEGVLGALRDVGGFTVYCAVEAEGWKISEEAPGVSMTRNYQEIEARSIFLALVDKAGSDGRGLEIEHAHNSGNQVFLATGPNEELGWALQEIVVMGRAKHISYEEPRELADTLRHELEINYNEVAVTIDDMFDNRLSKISARRMWRYLNRFAKRYEDFPLKPNGKEGEMEGNLDAAIAWVHTNVPEVRDYETFKTLEQISESRLA